MRYSAATLEALKWFKGPQGTAGVIDENVASRIKDCVRQDCISQALKAVESNGMMSDGHT